MSTATLFGTGILCSHCNNDPERDPRNGYLWHGFVDADTGQLVCMKCRQHHYILKQQPAFKNQYSEMPVVIETYRLNHKLR